MRDAVQQLLADAQRAVQMSDQQRAAWVRRAHDCGGVVTEDEARAVAAQYAKLLAADPARTQLLRLLAAGDSAAALAIFADLVARDPPTDSRQVALAFVPLFQRSEYPAEALFPRLLDGVAHPATAPLVLDLCNYLARSGRMPEHPAAPRGAALAALLGEVVSRLAHLEERPQEYSRDPAELSRLVQEGVTLVVSLCDALAGIGDDRAVGKLRQALALSHRRVQTEAAAALARLDDPEGATALALLAAEPATRTRALAYLEELGRIDDAKQEHRTPAARAIGYLAAHLAEPAQFGLAPQRLRLIDETRLRWPGFAEPVECFLVEYEYRLPRGTWTGIGLGGPLVHAMRVDLADLPPADIYAAYAGWSAEHEEIRETAADHLPDELLGQWRAAQRDIASHGFEQIELVKLGQFFGELHWVATAHRGQQQGVLIADPPRVEWHPRSGGRHAPGPDDRYLIHKGKKLLQAFNSP